MSYRWDFKQDIVLEKLAVRFNTTQDLLCVYGHVFNLDRFLSELHKVLGSHVHFILEVILFGLGLNELLRNSAQFEDVRDVVKDEHCAELVFVEHFGAAEREEHLFFAVFHAYEPLVFEFLSRQEVEETVLFAGEGVVKRMRATRSEDSGEQGRLGVLLGDTFDAICVENGIVRLAVGELDLELRFLFE